MCVLFIFFQDTELELNHDVEIRAMMSLRPPGAAVGPGPWGPGPTPAVQSRCLSFKADSEMYLSQASKTVWGLFRRSLFHHQERSTKARTRNETYRQHTNGWTSKHGKMYAWR